jgi:lipoprotein signal peptidase
LRNILPSKPISPEQKVDVTDRWISRTFTRLYGDDHSIESAGTTTTLLIMMMVVVVVMVMMMTGHTWLRPNKRETCFDRSHNDRLHEDWIV